MSHQFESEQQSDGGWITRCVDHPGVWGGGSTRESAYEECRLVVDDFHRTFDACPAPSPAGER